MQVRTFLASGAAAAALTLGCSAEPASDSGTGGVGTGGAATGGTAIGGSTTGGSATGGTAIGGSATGGVGTGGSATGGVGTGGSTGRPAELPTTESQADIAAFIERGAYKAAPWISETAAPRDATTHGPKVRVWENPPLVASLKGMRDGRDNRPFPDQWSMAVKELYDDAGVLVGAAASLKTAPGSGFDTWTYYCYGPDNRCTSGGPYPKEMPLYGNSGSAPGSNCGFCHGFSVYTLPP